MRKIFFLISALVLVSSCIHAISSPLRERARKDVPFSEIKENIDKYKGSIFILGGIIVSTKNTDEGSIIEAVQTPIDRYGALTDSDKTSGRFMAIDKGYLDPLIYKKNREVTIAGELIGSRVSKIGEIDYTFPLFAIKEIYLWKKDRGYYLYPSPYPPYMYDRHPNFWYDPWWYGPYYGPQLRH